MVEPRDYVRFLIQFGDLNETVQGMEILAYIGSLYEAKFSLLKLGV
jgi:hypothetical protein